VIHQQRCGAQGAAGLGKYCNTPLQYYAE
jgi:hypothetical protein